MSRAILTWLAGNDTGASSKALAIAAMGVVGSDPAYPSDCGDFGRCYRLLKLAPEAASGLERLASEGGPHWAALITRWSEITAAYEADREATGSGRRAYDLMKEILAPTERRDPRHVTLGNGVSIRFGA